MKIVGMCVMTALTFGLPFAASAQQSDAGGAEDIKYCNTLARSYQLMLPVEEYPVTDDAVAMSRCDAEPKATIAFFEKKVAKKKMDLPHNDRVAHSRTSTSNTQ